MKIVYPKYFILISTKRVNQILRACNVLKEQKVQNEPHHAYAVSVLGGFLGLVVGSVFLLMGLSDFSSPSFWDNNAFPLSLGIWILAWSLVVIMSAKKTRYKSLATYQMGCNNNRCLNSQLRLLDRINWGYTRFDVSTKVDSLATNCNGKITD